MGFDLDAELRFRREYDPERLRRVYVAFLSAGKARARSLCHSSP
jgi:hypothetical protein